MYQPATIPPPEGSDLLESWQIYYRVAQKLRLTLEVFDNACAGVPPPKINMLHEPTTDDLYELMCHDSAVPLSRVKQFAHGAIFEEAREIVRRRDPECTSRLQLADPHMMSELRGVRTEEILARRKTNAEYPFLLISRRMQTSNSSAIRPVATAKVTYNPAFMHPDDLRQLSLTAGGSVVISSRYGTIIGYAEPDASLRSGVVAMSHGFGARPGVSYDPRRDGANVNQLLSWNDDNDPYHGMPRMGAVPISVKAAAAEVPAETACAVLPTS